MTHTISYRLPRAELVVSGTVRRTRDTITDEVPLAEQSANLVSHAFVVRHIVGPDKYTVTLPGGWLRAFKGSFSFTSDRRLAGTAAESTGYAGTILTAAATVAGAALGLRAVRTGAGVALDDDTPAPADPAEEKYHEAHPAVSERREQIAQLLEKLQVAQLEAAEQVLDGSPDTAAARWDLLQRVRQSLESERDLLDAHFAAWRAGTIETADEAFEFAVPLTELQSSAEQLGPACSEKSPEAPKTLHDLWTRYGVGAAATWGAGRSGRQVGIQAEPSQIATRIPDRVTLSVVEHQHGVPVVTASSTHLVMDDYSEVEYFRLEKSLFGRRSLALTFDGDGVVTGVAVEGAASLAEAASAAGQLPAAVGAGVGSLNTAVSGLATARRAAREAELAQVKQQVELEQQRITEAGLHATAADAARLQRLQQLRTLLDTQAAISKSDPRLVASLPGPSTHPDWYQAPANEGAPSR
jgi:hypothetical protein